MAATAVGTKTNELPGTRAQMRYARFSASKARAVLDLVRGLPVGEAAEVLQFTDRGPSVVIAKVLASAIANAEHNDELDGDSLYVSACYADEGPTLKRWRPRARGRATRIRKRTCHITIIVSPMPDEMAARLEARQAATPTRRQRGRRAQESRRARVARSRGEAVAPDTEEEAPDEEAEAADEAPEAETDDTTEAGGEPNDEMVEDAEEAAEATADENPEDEADEPDEAESPEHDETTDDRGVEGAGGGVAEGDASTEAKDEK
jgi:large subunit ribosomal protein L22